MKILTSTGSIFGAIEEIVERATKHIHIVSPYIQLEKKDGQWSRLMDSLVEQNKDLQIVFITRKPDDKSPEKRLEKTQAIRKSLYEYSDEIWLVPNLHAKCYFNGDRALTTSMNLYYHSTKDNFEIGVDFEGEDDLPNLELIDKYISVLVRNGEEIRAIDNGKQAIELQFKQEGEHFTVYSENQEELGFCIVCKKKIALDAIETHVIRCKDCWKDKRRGFVKGNYCHICGAEASISTNKPACRSCYRQLKPIRLKLNKTEV